ncbi:EAL and HDOD domain-containing protein [Desulfovibrio inopinatus]|uniref:EAL and HDOD domain-containing protein n=1 Tax=Desulfovibrio inopinatus TaxID=102109 RepID=UPI0003F5D8BF|nr:HDOD domain-containing protein [Desulfovibrio inopinatus]
MPHTVPEFENRSIPVFISRQPVFDRKKILQAYKVMLHHAAGEDAGVALATEGMANALQGIGENARIFIASPPSVSSPDELFHIHKDRLALIMDCSGDNLELCIAGYQELKQQGFCLILDNYDGRSEHVALLHLADIVSLSIGRLSAADVLGLSRQVKKVGADVMASDIQDWESFEGAKALRFEYFHGPFFGKLHMVPGRSMTTASLSRVRLFKALNAPDSTVDQLADVVAMDPALVYKLLKFINAASMGFKSRITSIPHAINLLGIVPFRRWALAVIMSDFDNTTRGRELVYLALQRSRFLELIGTTAQRGGYAPDTLLLFGLFSKLDALAGRPMDELIDDMALNPIIKDALKGRKNSAHDWLDLLEAVETGDWQIVSNIVNKYAIPPAEAAKNYFLSAYWAKTVIGVLERQ